MYTRNIAKNVQAKFKSLISIFRGISPIHNAAIDGHKPGKMQSVDAVGVSKSSKEEITWHTMKTF
mgnify:CR=1 FL=1